MIGPIRSVPGMSPSATNRSGGPLPKHRVVALMAPAMPGELAVGPLSPASLRQGFGVTQEDCLEGRAVAVHRAGALLVEAEGSAVINGGRLVYAVPNADRMLAGRVAEFPAVPAAGEYLVVGHARVNVAAAAGAIVPVEACTPYLVRVPA